MKRIVTALCALSFAGALSGAALADCSPGHASAQPTTQTDSKGT